MSCLFSDDIAVGAEARDTLAIGVTGYSHPSRARGEKKSGHNYISFFVLTQRRRMFRTKIAAVLVCINTALYVRTYRTRRDKKSRTKSRNNGGGGDRRT